MVKNYSVKTKLTKEQLKKLDKNKNFTHSKNADENGEYELDVDLPDLKSYNKFKRLQQNGKAFRVKSGDGIFNSLKRSFNKVGNTLKNTFSEKNMKNATKVAVPAVVGGLTSFGVTPVASVATGNPVAGVVLGSLAGAAANQGTKVALDKALGKGIKKGSGISDIVLSLASDPAVKQALISAGLMAGSYLTKQALNSISKRIGPKKFKAIEKVANDSGVMDSNPILKDAKNYYQQGLREQQKFNEITNPDNIKKQVENKFATTVYSEPSYSFGNGIIGYGRGVSGYKRGGAVIVDPVNTGAIQDLNKSTAQFAKVKSNARAKVNVGEGIETYAEQIGAIQDLNKPTTQFERMSRVRSFRNKKI